MEVQISSDTTTLTWEYCPEEILRIIFRNLNDQWLLPCMFINRRWKDILLKYIEHYSFWPRIFSATMVHNGRTFKSNSVLSMKDMCMNSMLWSSVVQAKITLVCIYPERNVTCMHVYKDKIILTTKQVTDRPIKYYNIKKLQLIKSIGSAGVRTTECRENDHMIVYFGHEFIAYGKETPEDTVHDEERMVAFRMVLCYTMEDNVCYVYTNLSLIFTQSWDGKKWKSVSRGRYYRNSLDSVCGIDVFDGRVCLLTQLGFVYREDLETRNYHKVNSHNLVARIQDSKVLAMFDYNKVAVSEAFGYNLNGRVTVSREANSTFMWLDCEKMTCFTEHGAVLFMGFSDGAVGIYTLPATTASKEGKMSRLFNVRDFDRTIKSTAICQLEVFEDTLSHHLFVRTQDRLLQLLFTYPEYIKELYD